MYGRKSLTTNKIYYTRQKSVELRIDAKSLTIPNLDIFHCIHFGEEVNK